MTNGVGKMPCITNDKGSLTIEAVLVFSTVLLSISIFLFSVMFMYNKIILTKTAVDTAEKAANILLIAEGEIFLQEEVNGAEELNEKLLQLTKEIMNESEQKSAGLKKLQADLYRELANGFIKPQLTKITISTDNELLTRSVKVVISQDIRIPFGRLKALSDGQDSITVTGTGIATIIDPPQYIRNVDLSLEYLYRLKNGDILVSGTEK